VACTSSLKRPHWSLCIHTDDAGEMTYHQEQSSWVKAREVEQGGAAIGSHSGTSGRSRRRGQGQNRKPPEEAPTAT